MEISKLDEIRKLGIIAMFSDDDLMEMFVLKGGNAKTGSWPRRGRKLRKLNR